MAADKSKSLIMAQRLKALRTEKGLSHESLRKALMEKYEIDISVDSLKNYEVSKVPHAKAYKNEGMRVEYLRCLAEFYGVSADYLLGLSDVRTQDTDIRMISNATGLTEKNAAMLCYARRLSEVWNDQQYTEVIQSLIYNLGKKLGVPGFDGGCYLSDYKDYYAWWASCIYRFANDLLDAYTSSANLMDSYSGMLDYLDRTSNTNESVSTAPGDSDIIIPQKGLIMLTPCGYARYMAGEISKKIDSFIAEKYGPGDSDK